MSQPTALRQLELNLHGYGSTLTDPRPLNGYFALATGFALALSGALAAVRKHRGELQASPTALDVVLGSVATYKLSRVIAKDDIAAFVRGPFVSRTAVEGEIIETPRGAGLRMATGELLTCPLCLGVWCGGAFAVGHVAAPRATRAVALALTVSAGAEALQLAYSRSANT